MSLLHELLSGMLSHDANKVHLATERINSYLTRDDPDRIPMTYDSDATPRVTEEVALIRRLLTFNRKWASVSGGRDDSLPLHFAAHHGNMELFRIIYTARPTAVNVSNRKGKLPLHFAAREGHLDIVRFVLSVCPQSATCASAKQKLPLHFSVSEGHTKISRLLLEVHSSGAKTLTSKGKLPLHLAARFGHFEIVQMLLSSYPKGAMMLDWEWSLPLHDAALENHEEVVMILLRSFPQGLRQLNIRGELPLNSAMRHCNSRLVYEMLRIFPLGGKIVLQRLNVNDRVNFLSWDVLELCLRGATGAPLRETSHPVAHFPRVDFYPMRLPCLERGRLQVGVHPLASIPVDKERTDVLLLHVQPWPKDVPYHGHGLPDKVFKANSFSSGRCENKYFLSDGCRNGAHDAHMRKRQRKAAVCDAAWESMSKNRYRSDGRLTQNDISDKKATCEKTGGALSFDNSSNEDTTGLPLGGHFPYHELPSYDWRGSPRDVWNYAATPFLPLHTAIECMCSGAVLSRVLASCMDQVSVLDVYGRLPLHLVAADCQRGSPMTAFLAELVDIYPHAAYIRDNSNRLPFHVGLLRKAEYRALNLLMKCNPSSAFDACLTRDECHFSSPLTMGIISGCDVSVIYTLLRNNPVAVQEIRRAIFSCDDGMNRREQHNL